MVLTKNSVVFIKRIGLIAVLIAMLGTAQSAQRNNQAPFFSLQDTQGKVHTFNDYEGKPLIIHFWATWCPYCKKLQPGLEQIKQDYSDTDLNVIGINFLEDDGAQPGEVLKARGISFISLVEGEEVAKAYGVLGTPTTVFINRKGERIWTTNTSDPLEPKLKQAAEFILAE